jgi:3-ketosteroid 9alpha-monooxygenase subunit B
MPSYPLRSTRTRDDTTRTNDRGGADIVTQSWELPVLAVTPETDDAVSISLGLPQGEAAEFRYLPGQFLTVAVPSERTGLVARCYSLCTSPLDESPLTITIKRTAGGYASNWLNDNLASGDVLRCQAPSGIFTPRSLDDDALLFAGGSGITPVMSIIRTVLGHGRGRLVLLYANQDEHSVIFAEALSVLATDHPERFVAVHWLESVQGLPGGAQLREFARPYADYDTFCCGPAPFMKVVSTALRELGIPRSRRHQERFVSLGGNVFDDAEPAS